jgi:tight adherence protein C
MDIAIYILIFLAIYAVFYALAARERKIIISEKLGIEKGLKKPNPVLAIFTPLSKIFLREAKTKEDLRGKLLSIKSDLSPEEFISLKFIFMLVLFFLAITFLGKKPLLALVGIFVGFLLPEIWLAQKIRAHKASIQRILPETIDLLALCIGAGLDFTGAVRWITEKAKPNAMTDELKVVLSEMKVGKPRLEALKDMSKRLNILDVTSFVHNLVLAERMGTPVEETFAILSDDIRFRRTQRGERQALQAPIKILIPLVLCILPIILIIVAGPVILKFMQGGLFNLAK